MATARVYSVDEVLVTIALTKPARLILQAFGRTPTSGWTDGALSQRVYVTPPADGIQDFDFVGRPLDPGTPGLDVLTPIIAHAELTNVELATFWGMGLPLKGIRVHADANSKTVSVLARAQMMAASARMAAGATASFIEPTDPNATPKFEQDIKPLFRPRDVSSMLIIRGFNLHKYDDVKTHADDILKHLRLDMPCDGLWPAADIAKFEAWKTRGMPA